VLTVAIAQLDGGPASDAAVQGGIACELVQTGSLYHDDVIDESYTRRGVETVNAKWGNLQAILAGDFLLAKASEIAASLGTEVAALLARTIGRLCEGEIEQLRHTYNSARPEASYLSSITGKTASLFATAARIGALVAGLPRELVDASTAYGEAFGMTFQVVDDVLDITATDEQLGKPAGHDMVEGVYTLPVLFTLQSGGVAASELLALLGKPLDSVERDKALDIVRSNGGVEYARRRALAFAAATVAACDALPPSSVTEALRGAPDALISTLG
jgi:heptaprenyl diphosphate synthase